MSLAAVHESGAGRLCCKSLFALVIKNSLGCRRDFRVKMWGTSSPADKLTGELGNVVEAAQIGVRRSDRLMAGKLSPSNFGLLQQYLPTADSLADMAPRAQARRSDVNDPNVWSGRAPISRGSSPMPPDKGSFYDN